MKHWLRVFGVSMLPAVLLLGATPAFAEEPPKAETAARTTKVKAAPPAVAKPTAAKVAAGPSAANGGSKVMLNTQPIPPGKAAAGPTGANGGSKVMLNTQPIPPGKAATGAPTNGSEKSIIFVGGKGPAAKTKAAPKAAPVAKTAG
jgi:hypothetical protein